MGKRGGDEWRLFCVAKKSIGESLVSELPDDSASLTHHIRDIVTKEVRTTTHSPTKK